MVYSPIEITIAVCRRTEPRPETNQHSENNHITKPPHSLVMTVVYLVPCGKRTVVVPWHSSLPLFIVSVYCCLPLDSHIHSTTSRLRVLFSSPSYVFVLVNHGLIQFGSVLFRAERLLYECLQPSDKTFPFPLSLFYSGVSCRIHSLCFLAANC